MSDEIQDTGTPSAAEPTTLAETGVVEPAQDTTTAPEPAAEPPKAYAWPDNWRDEMAGGDDKIKALLARYTSPAAAAKAFRDLRTTYDSRDTKKDPAPELPENATPEQLEAYRKAKGIPASADDYQIAAPEGVELSDDDREVIADFAKAMHSKNMPADVVREMSSWFFDYQDTIAQKRAETAYKTRTDTEERLRQEWGPDYRANVNLMSNVLQEHLGTTAGNFLSTTLVDGSRLGDNETFIRMMAEISRKIGGSTADLYTSDVHTSGVGLETRKTELMKMMNDPDPLVRKKYWGDEVQSELQRIQGALQRRAG